CTAYTVTAVLVLSFFWSYIHFNPGEIALQLREHGSFVPGLRPGEKTASYLNGILARLTLCGGVCLAGLALLPAGSALLIVVGVALDIARRLEHAVPLEKF